MKSISHILFKPVSYSSLVVYRIIFGLLTLFSSIRFAANGWIEELYLEPQFHFKYFGFEWVTIGSPFVTYTLFALMILSSIGITLGAFYRLSISVFFLLFTYFELIDLTNYLNHYYFVSLMALLLIFLPANVNFSLDTRFGFVKRQEVIPNWCLLSIKLQLSLVYFFAGLAKLDYDWLIEAQPLSIWLAPHTNFPLIGGLMDEKLTAYLFSVGGAIFDLAVPFLLWSNKYRPFAYFFVVIFHVLTSLLFPIGVFPFVMILSTLIFFSPSFHKQILVKLGHKPVSNAEEALPTPSRKLATLFLLFFLFQLLFPFRYLLYPNDLFWTEQGYRFSWRVMLMEKAGYASFTVYPYGDDKGITVDNSEYLTPQQEKMMSTQPDFILQYAHFIGEKYRISKNIEPKVTVESYVSINGKGSQRYVKKDLNLMPIKNSLTPITFLETYQ